MASRRSWVKADNPFWSNHVAAWYRGTPEAETYCRKHDLSTTSLMRWARHLVSSVDLRKRAEHLRNLSQASKRQQKEKPLKRQKEASAQSLRRAHGQRSDCSAGVLEHACRSDDFSGMGHAEHAAALVSLRIRCALTRSPGTIRQRNGLLHRSARAQLSSAAICARCKYRLTRQGTDVEPLALHRRGKAAMVQEMEEPGVRLAAVYRRIASLSAGSSVGGSRSV